MVPFSEKEYEWAKIAYDGYCSQSGGRSLVSGAALPVFADLKPEIRDAWAAAAVALVNR